MNTLEFFQRVLPPEGNYCTVVVNVGSSVQQAFFGTVEELATNCQRLDLGGNNTYYALSTFVHPNNRKQVNSALTKSLFLDIDCGPDKVNIVDADGIPQPDKGYPDQVLGLKALLEFIQLTNMPPPMIVSSGRGLHIYWVLDEALPKEEWQPLADALKSTYQVHGFIFDPAVTADRARVLRPVGTHNPKNGKEVVLLRDAEDTTRAVLQNILRDVSPPTRLDSSQVSALPSIVPKQSALSAALAVTSDFPLANPVSVYNGCKQVQWAVDNQTKVSEPTWYSLMGVAAYCHNGESIAKLWSNKHADYNEFQVVKKMQQWKANTTGPSTCKRFKDERPSGCKDCPIAGRITSPCQLGSEHVVTPPSSDLPDGIDPTLIPPKPFKNTKVGIVQTLDGSDVEVCPFEIAPVGYGRDHHLGYETVRYKWRRPHVGWQDLVFRQAYLNDESREFATVIADQGIVLKGKKQTGSFQYMLRAYMDELRKKRSMSNIHGSMGWKEDFTQFVIGERLYKRSATGSVTVENISLSAATGNVGKSMYSMKGSAKEWSEASKILETANMPWHIFALNNTFAAPLWAFTGLKGITVSLVGNTGGGKSIIQLMMQSVWGDPSKLHFAAKFTHNALFNRLGVYANLPMTIDEATYMDDVGDFCYWVTQGRDKARLSRTAVEREAREWATSVTVSTNISFASKMAASGIETDAQMARLLEVEIPMHKLFEESSNAGRTIANFLQDNHGYIGDALVRIFLSMGEVELRRRIKDTTEKFGQLYQCKFHGSERYWETDLILQHVACSIAEEHSLISYNFRLGIQYIVDHIEAMRTAIQDNHTTGFTLIKEYLNEIAADALTVMHTQGLESTVDQYRIPRGEIKARFDVYRTGRLDKFNRGTVMLVRKNFKTWLASNGYDWNHLVKEVADCGANATPSSKRCNISKDTALKAGQHYVLGINLNNIEMLGFLDDIQQSAEDMTLGQMSTV